MRSLFHSVPALAIVLASSFASAHTSDAGSRPHGWTWDPYISVPVLVMALLYAFGMLRIRQRGTKISRVSVLCFSSGWLSLFLALDSPLHAISEQLFWVHMTQHEILMLIAAPLLIISRPATAFLFALPEEWRLRIPKAGRARVVAGAWLLISAPVAAWMLHAIALWAWHAPRLFDAALQSDWVHAAQHISFFGTALLFWWALFHRHAGRLGYGGAILYVFTTAVHTSVLGALLTFAPKIWYAPYTQTTAAWGLTEIQDQQIGGLIMWVPAGTLLTIVALVLVAKWMSHSQQRWEYTRTAELIRASQGTAQ